MPPKRRVSAAPATPPPKRLRSGEPRSESDAEEEEYDADRAEFASWLRGKGCADVDEDSGEVADNFGGDDLDWDNGHYADPDDPAEIQRFEEERIRHQENNRSAKEKFGFGDAEFERGLLVCTASMYDDGEFEAPLSGGEAR